MKETDCGELRGTLLPQPARGLHDCPTGRDLASSTVCETPVVTNLTSSNRNSANCTYGGIMRRNPR
eukprot:9418893-Pyramimonas_sp.AAC.1